MKSVQYEKNDIYFMEIVDDMLIINDNYQGVIIMDKDFNIIKKIKILDELIIDTYFIYEKNILVFCSDQKSFVYLDLLKMQEVLIPAGEFNGWIFSPFFRYASKKFVLFSYTGDSIEIDLESGRIYRGKEISNSMKKLIELPAYKVYSTKKKAFIQISHDKIGLIDFSCDRKILYEFPQEQYHDFAWMYDCIAKIGESKVEIIKNSRNILRLKATQDIFLRGRFMDFKDEKRFYLLSSLKSNVEQCTIQMRYI